MVIFIIINYIFLFTESENDGYREEVRIINETEFVHMM